MITTMTGQHGYTFHAINRDGTAALCRANLTPRTWPTTSSTTGYAVALYRLPGDPFSRSCSRERVNCLACQRKLAKITAEAFDAAALEGELHQDAPVVVPAQPSADFTTAATLDHVNQRVYLYDGEADQHVAGNVVAVIGQNLGTIVVEAWVERGTRKALFYRQSVRNADQLRAVVEVPVAAKVLHMRRADSNLVFRVLGADGSGRYPGVHLVARTDPAYEIDRDLRELEEDGWVACDAEGNVQAATVRQSPPLVPFPNADHLIGERVTLTSADPRQSTGTISGTIARVRPASLGSAHAVAELESGWLVDLPASLVEATAPRR